MAVVHAGRARCAGAKTIQVGVRRLDSVRSITQMHLTATGQSEQAIAEKWFHLKKNPPAAQ